jgi:hypothetical protein
MGFVGLSSRQKRPNDFQKHLQIPAKCHRAPLQFDANLELSVNQKDGSGILQKPYRARHVSQGSDEGKIK